MNIIPLSPGSVGSSSPESGPTGLILPIAPRKNARMLCSSDKVDARVLVAEEALAVVDDACRQGSKPDLLIFQGPGDPLATPEATFATLGLLREAHPQIPVAIATLGFNGASLADSLRQAGVAQIHLQVATVDTAKIPEYYAWIRPGTRTVPLNEAGPLLVGEQAKAARAFVAAGLRTVLHTIVGDEGDIPEVEGIARTFAAYGVQEMTLFGGPPLLANDGSATEIDLKLLNGARTAASRHLRRVALGGKDAFPPAPAACRGSMPGPKADLPKPLADRPNVAVVSASGMDVDLHLGQAQKILIYGPRADGLACLLGIRQAPEPGGGNSRWQALADILTDCFVILTTSAGPNPRKILASAGIRVLITEDSIDGVVDVLYGGGKKGKKKS